MQRDELDVPNVHDHTLDARHRTTNGSGRLHRIVDEPQTKWYHRLFKWETIDMPHKNVERGFVITPAIAGVLLASLLGAIGWAYTSNTKDARETHDAVIRMETMLNERTQTFREQQAAIKNDLDTERRVAELQREKQRDELREMKVTLQQHGIRVGG